MLMKTGVWDCGICEFCTIETHEIEREMELTIYTPKSEKDTASLFWPTCVLGLLDTIYSGGWFKSSSVSKNPSSWCLRSYFKLLFLHYKRHIFQKKSKQYWANENENHCFFTSHGKVTQLAKTVWFLFKLLLLTRVPYPSLTLWSQQFFNKYCSIFSPSFHVHPLCKPQNPSTPPPPLRASSGSANRLQPRKTAVWAWRFPLLCTLTFLNLESLWGSDSCSRSCWVTSFQLPPSWGPVLLPLWLHLCW